SCIGRGGTSAVYKARDLSLDRTVAIKVLSHCSDQGAVQRLRQEAHAVSRLRNPHIITVHEFHIPGDAPPYMVMDYVAGVSLHDWLASDRRLSLRKVIEILTQACEALVHAHGNGVIHRDLKPSNIMLCQDEHGNDVVKLVDFGIAKVLPQKVQAQSSSW